VNTPDPQQEQWLARMKEGRSKFTRGDLPAAIEAFSGAAQLLPARPESWINLGTVLLNSGRLKDCVRIMNRALNLGHQNDAVLMVLGDALRLLGRWTAAVQCYEGAVSHQRSPMALNKLACAIRSMGKYEDAEKMLEEALEKNNSFNLARLNLATLSMAKGDYDTAESRLAALSTAELAPAERAEADCARAALQELRRLRPAIESMAAEADLQPLRTLLAGLPEPVSEVDEAVLKPLHNYVESAARLPVKAVLQLTALPDEWPLIEALFMIPVIDRAADFNKLREAIESPADQDSDLSESLKMIPAITAARTCRNRMNDPVEAEVQLRHWHSLACTGLDGFMPGHFKYTQNWAPGRNPTLRRVRPSSASATFQQYIQRIYSQLPPGLPRALVSMLAVKDLHCFGDGNGRMGLIWLNRELEWANLMPALFSRELSMKGALGEATQEVRTNGGNLEPLLEVLVKAQHHAVQFCRELAD